MSTVVFDANVFVQAALSDRGPAFACLESAKLNNCQLLVTESILAEVREVMFRLSQVKKYADLLTEDRILAYLELIRTHAQVRDEPPEVATLDRDPDDEVYLNLAISADCEYLVTRDKDLLEFDLDQVAAGRLRIVQPVEFLKQWE